jgi:hypothetical protein
MLWIAILGGLLVMMGIRRRSADQHFAKTNSILDRVVGS